MYAQHRYTPQQSRGVSFGAALLINGGLMAALIVAAQVAVEERPENTTTIFDVPREVPLPPPPIPPKPQPRTDRASTSPQPNAPDPVVPTKSDNRVETTETIYPPIPPMPPAPLPGPATPADPPALLPPLVAANPDARYARDFQPPYPAAELRAQRDGRVSIRVLIGIDGRVKAVEPVSATSPAFFEATQRQALAKWRFKPATRGGIPQESWRVMSVRFEIANL